MSVSTKHLILGGLRAILFDSARLRDDLRAFRRCIGTLEQLVAQIQVNQASHHAGVSSRLDRIIARIERRLEVIPAA